MIEKTLWGGSCEEFWKFNLIILWQMFSRNLVKINFESFCFKMILEKLKTEICEHRWKVKKFEIFVIRQ